MRVIIIISILVGFIACHSNNKKNRKLQDYYLSKSENQDSLNPNVILRTQKKVNLLEEHERNEYSWYKGEMLYRCFVQIKDLNNVGIYSYKPNTNHLSFEKYFFNYFDTVVFVQQYDTTNWNTEVESIKLKYQEMWTSEQKGILDSLILGK